MLNAFIGLKVVKRTFSYYIIFISLFKIKTSLNVFCSVMSTK